MQLAENKADYGQARAGRGGCDSVATANAVLRTNPTLAVAIRFAASLLLREIGPKIYKTGTAL